MVGQRGESIRFIEEKESLKSYFNPLISVTYSESLLYMLFVFSAPPQKKENVFFLQEQWLYNLLVFIKVGKSR